MIPSTYTKINMVELSLNLKKKDLLAFKDTELIEMRKSCA